MTLPAQPGAAEAIPSCPQQEALLQELAGIILVDADLTEAWRAVSATLSPQQRAWSVEVEIRAEDGTADTGSGDHEETTQLALVADALREECAQHGIAWTRLRILAEREPGNLDRIGISAEPLA